MRHTEEMIAAAGTTHAALSRQLDADRTELEAHRAECQKLGEALEALEQRSAANNEEIDALNTRIDKLTELIDSAADDIRRREEALMDLRVSLSVLETPVIPTATATAGSCPRSRSWRPPPAPCRPRWTAVSGWWINTTTRSTATGRRSPPPRNS
jgi:hypothetical protein